MPFKTNTWGKQTCRKLSFPQHEEKTSASGPKLQQLHLSLCTGDAVALTVSISGSLGVFYYSANPAPFTLHVLCYIALFMCFVTYIMHVRNQCGQYTGVLKKEWMIKINCSLSRFRPYISGYIICPVGKKGTIEYIYAW